MALSVPNFGEGFVLEVDDGASAAFVELDNYISVTPPPENHAKVARKVLRRDRTINVVSPVLDVGDMAVVFERSQTSAARVEALRNKVRTYRGTYMDGDRFSFVGTLYMKTPGTVADGNALVTDTYAITVQSLITKTTATPPTLPTTTSPPLSA